MPRSKQKPTSLSPQLLMMSVLVIFAGVIGLFFVLGKAMMMVQPQPQDSEVDQIVAEPSALDTFTLEQKMQFTNDQWKQYLTPLQYNVLRQAGTEIPFTGEYVHNEQKGTYVTADCGEPVFRSEQKFDSRTGWPSFTDPINKDAVELRVDNSDGMKRTEVVSKKCGSHLGHLFDDGPAPTGNRYCINSVALKFIPDEDQN